MIKGKKSKEIEPLASTSVSEQDFHSSPDTIVVVTQGTYKQSELIQKSKNRTRTKIWMIIHFFTN